MYSSDYNTYNIVRCIIRAISYAEIDSSIFVKHERKASPCYSLAILSEKKSLPQV